MANLLSQFFDLFSSDRRAPIYQADAPTLPMRETHSADAIAPAPAPANVTLQPLRSWSYPFKDKRNSLLQLTQLAQATAGYYPLGRNGLWHGGVHFDSGTARTLDQSSVHCLADGEVVAYRIDEHSPTTSYFTETATIHKPFSRSFVLVRHHLQPPKIEGSQDIPPSLIFYSLYMHLQDLAVYQRDPTIARPGFWPEGQTRRVKATVTDTLSGHPGQQGLKVRNRAQGGEVLALLPRGAQVTVSGEGDYRKLENTIGPDGLKGADGSLRGYLSINFLEPIAGDGYRIKGNSSLNVRAEANISSTILAELPHGTEVMISGEGEFRKLERVDQYVHFNSLEGAREPMADRIVVLDQPIAINAGELIGHIGEYQDGGAEHPERKLHLEVFSGDDVELFIEASRAWADRLPITGKIWLKLVKGTAVVAHQERFSTTQPPTLSAASTSSDADLWVPKGLLDNLPAEDKLVIPATADRKAYHWYRLKGLLHDANHTLLDGWVREEVGVTPWVNPWSWDGYGIIHNYDAPRQYLASFFRATGRFSEEEVESHRALADKADNGAMMRRLYDIIDRDHDGKMTAEELQAAISLPAHAQALSQLIIYYDSEWQYSPRKWDALDGVLGHSGSTPLLNWVAEKERIKQISWWNEVAPQVGLSALGSVYHFHPVGLIGNFLKQDECACGCCLDAIFTATRYGQQYGPVYWGKITLSDFQDWKELAREGAVTSTERDILVAMSQNEGNMDAIQSYDSEVLTAGAMQKTINPQGAGELPQQVHEFKQAHPELYRSLFSNCGWEVKAQNGKQYLYYNGITGSELKALLRNDFNQTTFENKAQLASRPLAAFINAITNDKYLTKQVIDFARRLRTAIALTPGGYNSYKVSDYIHSKLGKAVILDHHVNRPGYVSRDFGRALESFLTTNPAVSENPASWGSDHAKYESALLDIYGPSRDMTNSSLRYQHLKSKL